MADLKVKRRVLSACQTNCYYVYREGSDEIAIIDPGDNGEVVYDDVKSLGFEKIAGICQAGLAKHMVLRPTNIFTIKRHLPWRAWNLR